MLSRHAIMVLFKVFCNQRKVSALFTLFRKVSGQMQKHYEELRNDSGFFLERHNKKRKIHFPMTKLIYIDTNVYIDYFHGRSNGLRPLGDFAFEIIRRTLKCEFEIIISSWVIEELEKHSDEKRIGELQNTLAKKDKVTNITYNSEDKIKAKAYKNWTDALHAIIALKAGAEYLVTRNTKDFHDFSDKIEVIHPESL